MDQAEKKLAKKIALIAADAGEAGVTEVIAAIKKYLEPKSVAQRKEFSKIFLHYLKSEIKKSEILIEYTGKISDAEINLVQSKLQEQSPRKLSVKTKENDELIAGLRISLADNVYDMSIAGRLNQLSSTIK